MKTVNKAYRFRIYPNREQEALLSKHFGCSRFVYNHFLNQRKEQYDRDGKSDDYYAQAKALTELKKQEGMVWLKEVNSQSLQFALRCLDTAYVNFFRGTAKFPKFKSKKDKNSFTVPQFASLEDGKLYLPKFKDGIKVRMHRAIVGEVGKMSLTRTPTGKHYVSVFTKQEVGGLPKTKKQVGIDLGIKDFAVTSDCKRYRNNRYTKRYAKQLRKAQQHLSRKVKGSNGHEKQRLKVARLHEKIAACRLDTLHKVSRELVMSYDLISVEDLNVKGMVRNPKLAKHIADASWGRFVSLLQYKCVWAGKELVKIGRFCPSSKTCHGCGWVYQGLKLSEREWRCSSCGALHDRDVNASKNILKEGARIYGQGLPITKVEGKSDSGNRAHPVKPEAQPIASGVGG